MYLRLWWKDARQFWPIWTFLILAAAALQGLVLHYGDPSARHFGGLGIVALGWATLYACAVGSAAFAGERESGTLRFLDVRVIRPTAVRLMRRPALIQLRHIHEHSPAGLMLTPLH